jgi:hypothetical protein
MKKTLAGKPARGFFVVIRVLYSFEYECQMKM